MKFQELEIFFILTQRCDDGWCSETFASFGFDGVEEVKCNIRLPQRNMCRG